MRWNVITDAFVWAALHFIVPFVVLLLWGAITSRKNFATRFLDYLRPTWEGGDGKISYRRASQFVFICLMVFVVVTGKTLTLYGIYTLGILAIVFLLLAAVISFQQVVEGIKGIGAIRSGIKDFGADVSQVQTKVETTTHTDVTIPPGNPDVIIPEEN
jgi:hypothetical protein